MTYYLRWGTPLGAGAADRRVRSDSEAAAGRSGRDFDRLGKRFFD